MTGKPSLTKVVLLAVGVLGLPVVASAQMAVEYYHLDAIGNVLVLTDNAGAVVEQHDYDVFGQEVNAQAGSQPKRFTGKERDQETGWDHFGARYYGSKIARFTTTDPVYTWHENYVDPQRWNRYAYARNNPLRYVDPDGREIRLQQNASSRLQRGYQTARAYLGGGGADRILKELDARPEVVTIVETTGTLMQDVRFDPDAKTIDWNPEAALRTTDGGTQSPASTLNHEMDHALRSLQDPQQFERDRTATDPQFRNREERRVVQGSEATLARIKGEDARRDSKGSLEKVSGADQRPSTRTMPE